MPSPGPFRRVDAEPFVEWWQDRYGLPPETFAGLHFYQRGQATIWLSGADLSGMARARVEAVGIRVLRLGARYWKPTSIAIISLASDATRNVIDLEEEEARRFLAGAECVLEQDDPRLDGIEGGFVVVRFCGVALGCGEWRRRTLRSNVPKGRRIVDLDL